MGQKNKKIVNQKLVEPLTSNERHLLLPFLKPAARKRLLAELTPWKLWLDDQVSDPETPLRWAPEGFIGAASTKEAIDLVKKLGPPEFIDFDHDLGMLPSGEEDTAKSFCKWLAENHPMNPPKDWNIHSQNRSPDAGGWINSFIRSWIKSLDM